MPDRSVRLDSDVDPRVRTSRREPGNRRWPRLAAISAGGVGALRARSSRAVLLRPPPYNFGWATFAINVSGCLLIGVLMVLVTQVWTGRPLLRPFLGIGVLGGFPTF